ncbi:hypothetical protein MVEN_01059600 [Mycena venus]|uniref:Uncharacterized protein n=1 Tax=Mycena venus TaxID=2733690 RepID=A0A8H7CZC4_9AGAR|nr:hypothetical protein MVEN_01059600 [Mycena venus]
MENFPITEAQIVGLFLESVFWGIYLITFFLCLRVLLFNSNYDRKRLSDFNWPMLTVCLCMCAFATMDVAVGLLHNIQAFVLYKGPGGPAEEFSHISDWVNIVKTVDVVMQTTLGDAMLIYRCWIIYRKSWRVVAFSILLWLGGAACTAMIIHVEATLHSNALITSSSLGPLVLSFWVLTITQNLLTTGLIVFRIWRVDRQNAPFTYHTNSSSKQHSRLREVMRIIIESGLMYTTIALLTFITQITNSNSTYGVSDVEVQVVGITFNLIIIRADGRRAAEEQPSKVTSTLPLHVLRRTAASNKEGVHVTVVSSEFRHDDGKVGAGGEREEY